MSSGYKLTFPCTRAEADALSGELPALAAFDPPPTLMTSEVDEHAPDAWRLDAYFDTEPDEATIIALQAMLPSSANAKPVIEQLADEDWVSVSQAGLEPFGVGRFWIRASHDAPPVDRELIDLSVDASRAFGTGHHETTFGCLDMLDRLKNKGARYESIADIGTGTGLLAFAALKLWPHAKATASDIDRVAVEMAARFALSNAIAAGRGRGELALATAPGAAHPLIQRRAPYDLVLANILAGPLIALAPELAAITAHSGTLILAGLLKEQADRVARAYRRQGFRLAERRDNNEWPTLRLVKRAKHGFQRSQRVRPVAQVGYGEL